MTVGRHSTEITTAWCGDAQTIAEADVLLDRLPRRDAAGTPVFTVPSGRSST